MSLWTAVNPAHQAALDAMRTPLAGSADIHHRALERNFREEDRIDPRAIDAFQQRAVVAAAAGTGAPQEIATRLGNSAETSARLLPLLGPARAAIGGTWRTLYRWSALLRRGLAARSKKHFPSPNPAIPPPPQVTLENRLSYKRAALPGERDYPAPAKEENLWMSDAHFSDATTARNRLGLCGAADGEWLFEYSIDLTADIRELWCPTALDAGTGRSAAAWRRPTSNAPWGFTRDLLTGAEAEREILMLSTDEDHRDLRSLGRVNGAPPDGYLKGL